MTPKEFDTAMRLFLKSGDVNQIAANCVKLISDELGAGIIEYMPSLVALSDRMRELRGQKNALKLVVDNARANVVDFPKGKS
jgi:uncharacterized PurR-regulated membrane protein YhhQ (DUF165 family)